MSKKSSNKVGRPRAIVPEVVAKLEDIFKIGGTVDEACSSIGISPATFYRRMEDDPDFERKMTYARHYADIEAKNVVVGDITNNKDVGTAKWWLEKRQFNTPTSQVNIAGKEINLQLTRGED